MSKTDTKKRNLEEIETVLGAKENVKMNKQKKYLTFFKNKTYFTSKTH